MSATSTDRVTAGTGTSEVLLFVINLCASTSPLALVHPSNPDLKRYTFFVTRQREDGRERFRLHMGYFSSQDEAEVLLDRVRDVYPAAWAGPAPTSGGAPRRPRTTSAAGSRACAGSRAASGPAAAPVPAPAPVSQVDPTVAMPAAAAPPPPAAPTLDSMSNVRAVIAQLGDEKSAGDKSAPVPARTQLQASPGATPPAAPARAAKPVAAAVRAVVAKPAPAAALTEAQALQLLESSSAAAATARAAPTVPPARAAAPVRRATPPPAARAPEHVIPEIPEGDSVRVVTPEDTQTLRDIRLDAERNAPPCFAVQLLWSVSPMSSHRSPASGDLRRLHALQRRRQSAGPPLVRAAPGILQGPDLRDAGGLLRAIGLSDRRSRSGRAEGA